MIALAVVYLVVGLLGIGLALGMSASWWRWAPSRWACLATGVVACFCGGALIGLEILG